MHNKPHTEEAKRRISKSLTGKKRAYAKRPNSMGHHRGRGYKFSLEQKQKMSERRKGNKHPMWIDGRTLKLDYESKRSKYRYYNEKDYRIKAIIRSHERRNLFLNAGKLSIKTIQRVYEDNIKKYGILTCYLCLKSIQFGKDSLEHKIPLSRGGTNDYENLAIACMKCNSKKYNKTYEEFLKAV